MSTENIIYGGIGLKWGPVHVAEDERMRNVSPGLSAERVFSEETGNLLITRAPPVILLNLIFTAVN